MPQQSTVSTPPLASEIFFKNIPPDVVARLEIFAHNRQYSQRQIIFFPDDRCDYVYWIRSGRVKITHTSDQHREISYRHLVKGDLFGEECLVNSTRRNYYAEALSPTILTLVRSADFARVLQEEVALGHAMACYSCRRALEVERMLSDFVFLEVRDRIIRRLWQLFCREQESRDDSLSLTHQELANLVGAARETVTCELHKLRDEGVIGLSNRRIDVKNPEVLHQLSGMESMEI